MAFTSRGMVRLVLFLLGYLGFLMFGSIVFTSIEGPEEKEHVRNLREIRMKFLQDHTCVTGK